MNTIVSPKVRSTLIETISGLLILLFVYVSVTKLIDYRVFEHAIMKSPILNPFKLVLPWLVPVVELCISYFLFQPRLRLWGFKASLILMTLFSLYIAYILIFIPIRPCGCGGVLQQMNWNQHFIFNMFFTVISLVGLLLEKHQVSATNRQDKKLPFASIG